MACIPPNPRRVGYIGPIHGPLDGPLYMGSIYSNTPRSLNNRRSDVQDWTRREYKESTKGKYPLQPQLATGYVEAGSKLREGRRGQPLGEDVSKLGGSRDMEYPNIADSDFVAHEVQVNLHMLRPLMLGGWWRDT